jgi:hypothetical protein
VRQRLKNFPHHSEIFYHSTKTLFIDFFSPLLLLFSMATTREKADATERVYYRQISMATSSISTPYYFFVLSLPLVSEQKKRAFHFVFFSLIFHFLLTQ